MDKKTKKVIGESAELITEKKHPIRSDILGSYTGRMKDPYETPVQDADDL